VSIGVVIGASAGGLSVFIIVAAAVFFWRRCRHLQTGSGTVSDVAPCEINTEGCRAWNAVTNPDEYGMDVFHSGNLCDEQA
jgi:hypothetical protein